MGSIILQLYQVQTALSYTERGETDGVVVSYQYERRAFIFLFGRKRVPVVINGVSCSVFRDDLASFLSLVSPVSWVICFSFSQFFLSVFLWWTKRACWGLNGDEPDGTIKIDVVANVSQERIGSDRCRTTCTIRLLV